MARFNAPADAPHPSNDNHDGSIDRIDASLPGQTPFGPAIHRFRKLLAQLIVRRFLNERRGGSRSDRPTE
jgi:hypothetical protein